MMGHLPREVADGMGGGVASWKAVLRETPEMYTARGGFEPIYSILVES
jgi:hypothetical protein